MLDRLLGVSPGVIDMTLDPLVGAPNGGVTTASWMTGAVHDDGQLPPSWTPFTPGRVSRSGSGARRPGGRACGPRGRAALCLTVHGETNPVSFDLDAQRTADGFRVNGSIPVAFADYGIGAPDFGGIAVEDEGDIEFLLTFDRA